MLQPTDPNAAAFAPYRADLARLFLLHKGDLRLDDWSDQQVIDRVNEIALALMVAGGDAVQRHDFEWLERFLWFSEACTKLFDAQPATRLDG